VVVKQVATVFSSLFAYTSPVIDSIVPISGKFALWLACCCCYAVIVFAQFVMFDDEYERSRHALDVLHLEM